MQVVHDPEVGGVVHEMSPIVVVPGPTAHYVDTSKYSRGNVILVGLVAFIAGALIF